MIEQDLKAAMVEAGLVPGQSPEPLRLPDPTEIFSRRAARLKTLADGHMVEDWLRFVAHLCDAQQQLLNRPQQQPQPPKMQWQQDLRDLLPLIRPTLNAAGLAVLASLQDALPSDLDDQQERILAGHADERDLAAAPFLAAARQVAWVRHAASLDAPTLSAQAVAHHCPVCGLAPVAGMILAGDGSAGVRYLHCGQCGTAWHHVRAVCCACGDSRDLAYHSIDGGDDGIRAECCSACHSTLKLFLLEKSPEYDPIADDLASLVLDVLVGEQGFQRIGGNPFMVIGR